jgi:hypothetical protein
MLSLADARDRSMRRAIETGEMGEMEFVHAIQRAERHKVCFGRMEEPCSRIGCRWHAECVALADTEAFPKEPMYTCGVCESARRAYPNSEGPTSSLLLEREVIRPASAARPLRRLRC